MLGERFIQQKLLEAKNNPGYCQSCFKHKIKGPSFYWVAFCCLSGRGFDVFRASLKVKPWILRRSNSYSSICANQLSGGLAQAGQRQTRFQASLPKLGKGKLGFRRACPSWAEANQVSGEQIPTGIWANWKKNSKYQLVFGWTRFLASKYQLVFGQTGKKTANTNRYLGKPSFWRVNTKW